MADTAAYFATIKQSPLLNPALNGPVKQTVNDTLELLQIRKKGLTR